MQDLALRGKDAKTAHLSLRRKMARRRIDYENIY